MTFSCSAYEFNKINIDDYISFTVSKLHLGAGSLRSEKDNFKYFTKWLDNRPINKQTVEEFFYFQREKGNSNARYNNFLHLFRHLAKYMKDRGIGDDEFISEFKALPLVRGKILTLSCAQVTNLMQTRITYGVFHGKDRTEQLNFLHTTIIQFFCETGCRFKDMRNLKVRDLNLSQFKITFRDRKNGETTESYLQIGLTLKLQKLIEGKQKEEFVFTNANNHQIVCQDFNRDLKERAHLTGIIPGWQEMHVHILRHTFITDLLTQGVPLPIVASLAGHKDIQSTYYYFSKLEKPMRQALTKLSWVKETINPQEILDQIADNFKSHGLQQDKRFDFRIEQTKNSLQINVAIK
jgi:site-specific recombinase XerD